MRDEDTITFPVLPPVETEEAPAKPKAKRKPAAKKVAKVAVKAKRKPVAKPKAKKATPKKPVKKAKAKKLKPNPKGGRPLEFPDKTLIRMPAGYLKALNAKAKAKDIGQAEFLREIIRRAIGK